MRALSWLGRHELAILLAIGGLAAGVWLFAALADEVMEGGTQKLDRKLLLALRRPGDLQPLGSPAFQDAARDRPTDEQRHVLLAVEGEEQADAHG